QGRSAVRRLLQEGGPADACRGWKAHLSPVGSVVSQLCLARRRKLRGAVRAFSRVRMAALEEIRGQLDRLLLAERSHFLVDDRLRPRPTDGFSANGHQIGKQRTLH